MTSYPTHDSGRLQFKTMSNLMDKYDFNSDHLEYLDGNDDSYASNADYDQFTSVDFNPSSVNEISSNNYHQVFYNNSVPNPSGIPLPNHTADDGIPPPPRCRLQLMRCDSNLYPNQTMSRQNTTTSTLRPHATNNTISASSCHQYSHPHSSSAAVPPPVPTAHMDCGFRDFRPYDPLPVSGLQDAQTADTLTIGSVYNNSSGSIRTSNTSNISTNNSFVSFNGNSNTMNAFQPLPNLPITTPNVHNYNSNNSTRCAQNNNGIQSLHHTQCASLLPGFSERTRDCHRLCTRAANGMFYDNITRCNSSQIISDPMQNHHVPYEPYTVDRKHATQAPPSRKPKPNVVNFLDDYVLSEALKAGIHDANTALTIAKTVSSLLINTENIKDTVHKLVNQLDIGNVLTSAMTFHSSKLQIVSECQMALTHLSAVLEAYKEAESNEIRNKGHKIGVTHAEIGESGVCIQRKEGTTKQITRRTTDYVDTSPRATATKHYNSVTTRKESEPPKQEKKELIPPTPAIPSLEPIAVKKRPKNKRKRNRFILKQNKNGGYKCSECGKVYKYICNLRSHSKVHTDAAHICEYCNKRFGRRANYAEHKRIHTGEQPFECLICGRRFKQRYGWKDHMKTHRSAVQKKAFK